MVEWQMVKLGDLADIYSGYAFKSKDLISRPLGIPVIKIANIQNHLVSIDEITFLPYEKYDPKYQKYILNDGDILISMTGAGSVGKIGKLLRVTDRYLVNQRVAIVRVRPSEAIAEYIYQVLCKPYYEEQMYSLGLGAGQPNISATDIGSLEIPLPPLETQRRIAAILSAYDDLIENNTRRIKLLEQAAHDLYREWFVEFRFPGHESVEMVDSGTEYGMIPQGWGVVKLEEVIELAYGKSLKADDRIAGDFPVYGSSGVVGSHNEYLVEAPGIIVGRKGNVGSVFWATKNFYPIDTVYYVNTELSLHYVFFNLKRQNFINNDAAVPGLSRRQAYSLPVVVPSAEALNDFDRYIEPIFGEVSILIEKNNTLREARDLLLPRLVSGELEPHP
jgi:type I restriction enzyme S subunit